MATTAHRYPLDYQTMVEFVRAELKPVEEHMAAHDNWHRDRITAEMQAHRAQLVAVWAVVLTALGIAANILIALWH